MAMMVDRGKFKWDDRVVDLDPDFQLKDPWVTREFRVFDLLAQRSGLPPYANDALGILGLDRDRADPVVALRRTGVEFPVDLRLHQHHPHPRRPHRGESSDGATDWNAVLRRQIFDPLGMKDRSYTAAAIEPRPTMPSGYRWTPDGTVEVPFTPIFPYDFDGAGDINSTIEDASRWLRLQLGNGSFEGRRIVSAANLTVTHTPKVAMSDKVAYAMGWIVQQTPNGTIVWHNGGTSAFGAYFGLLLEKDVGVVVLTNEVNVGLPDALGRWTLDRILGNPKVDVVAETFKAAQRRIPEIDQSVREACQFAAVPGDGAIWPGASPIRGSARRHSPWMAMPWSCV